MCANQSPSTLLINLCADVFYFLCFTQWKSKAFHNPVFHTLLMFHTPRFPHSTLRTLIFHSPLVLQFTFSTLLISHAPHFSTPLISHTPNSPHLQPPGDAVELLQTWRRLMGKLLAIPAKVVSVSWELGLHQCVVFLSQVMWLSFGASNAEKVSGGKMWILSI